MTDILKSNIETIVENTKKVRESGTSPSGMYQDFNGQLVEAELPTTNTNGLARWNDLMLSVARRAAVSSLAMRIGGVFPMAGPVGQTFCKRVHYDTQAGDETFAAEPINQSGVQSQQSGDQSGFAKDFFSTNQPAEATVSGEGFDRNTGEGLATELKQLAITVTPARVEAKTRKLKTDYSEEYLRDMLNLGLNGEYELEGSLADQITNEIDREFVRSLAISAEVGCEDCTTEGRFSLSNDSNGRWEKEDYINLVTRIGEECTAIRTNGGVRAGNYVITSETVARKFATFGLVSKVDYSEYEVQGGFYCIGYLAGGIKLFADPFATVDYCVVGFKGITESEASLYFSPYVIADKFIFTGQSSLQPKMLITSRYDITANPFTATNADGTDKTGRGLGQGENVFARKFLIVQ